MRDDNVIVLTRKISISQGKHLVLKRRVKKGNFWQRLILAYKKRQALKNKTTQVLLDWEGNKHKM